MLDDGRVQASPDHCTATYCFPVNTGATTTGNATVSWAWAGEGLDNPGFAAPHMVCSSDGFNGPLIAECDDITGALVTIPPCPTYPEIEIDPASVTVILQPSQSTEQRTLEIYNRGDADLHWSLSEKTDLPWLSEAPTSGTVSTGWSMNQVTLSFDKAGLTPGTYSGTLVIASDDPDEASVEVPVSLQVVGIPSLRLDPEYVSVQVPQGSAPITSTLRIYNDGNDVLTWSVSEYMNEYDWLTESPTSGSVPAGTDYGTLTLTFDPTGLLPAQYSAILALPNNDPWQSNKYVNVTMFVIDTTDTDGDGVLDSADNCPLIGNADQADTDDDGAGDACDNCPLAYNPYQDDSDGNGIGDACEANRISVESLVVTTKLSRRSATYTASITVVDIDGAPVKKAVVNTIWFMNDDTILELQGTTGRTGVARLTLRNVPLSNLAVGMCVQNVTRTGYVYVPTEWEDCYFLGN